MNPKIMGRKEKKCEFTHTQLSEINKTAVWLFVLDINNYRGSSDFCKISRKNSRIRNRRSFFPRRQAQLNFYSPLADLLYYLNSRQDFISLCSQPSLDWVERTMRVAHMHTRVHAAYYTAHAGREPCSIPHYIEVQQGDVSFAPYCISVSARKSSVRL